MTSTKGHKPFDLEAAKRGEPIMMEDGRPAKFLFHVPETKEIYVLTQFCGMAQEVVLVRQENGNTRIASHTRVLMAPKKTTLWFNIYRHEDGHLYSLGGSHQSSESAMNGCTNGFGRVSSNYVKTVTIEIEE
jgi:hypothetical protein